MRTPYRPEPIDTSKVKLDRTVRDLTELLARNAHEVWARTRMSDGWQYGRARSDARKRHPCLVPYEHLAESEKKYDRNAAMETLKAITALGYRIEKGSRAGKVVPRRGRSGNTKG